MCFWCNSRDKFRYFLNFIWNSSSGGWHAVPLELVNTNTSKNVVTISFKTILFVYILENFEYTYRLTVNECDHYWPSKSGENGALFVIPNHFNSLFHPLPSGTSYNYLIGAIRDLSIWFDNLLNQKDGNSQNLAAL